MSSPTQTFSLDESIPCSACDRGECSKHRTFRCAECRRVVSWDFGADDSDPRLAAMCDDCWCAATGATVTTKETQ